MLAVGREVTGKDALRRSATAMELAEEIQKRVLCGDGAIGTMLLEAGTPLDRCFEELCVTEPARVEEIHRKYVGAGARVIETNTFGANAVRLERFGLEGRVAEINHAAVQVAKNAAQGKKVYVAGSVGPLGISEEGARRRGIDRGQCFREQITALLEGGVDLIFFETFMDFQEMELAFRVRKEVGAGFSICSLTCARDGRLSSGLLLEEAFTKLHALGAEMVGVNCMDGSGGKAELIQGNSTGRPLAAYPNAGLPECRSGQFVYPAAPDDFALAARKMTAKGARLVGGCCGTTPRHIEAVAEMIATLEAARRPPGRTV